MLVGGRGLVGLRGGLSGRDNNRFSPLDRGVGLLVLVPVILLLLLLFLFLELLLLLDVVSWLGSAINHHNLTLL